MMREPVVLPGRNDLQNDAAGNARGELRLGRDLLPTLFLPGLVCDDTVWEYQLRALAHSCSPAVASYGDLDSLPDMAAAGLATAPERFVIVGGGNCGVGYSGFTWYTRSDVNNVIVQIPDGINDGDR